MSKTCLRNSVLLSNNVKPKTQRERETPPITDSKEIYYNNSFGNEQPETKIDVDPRLEITFKHLDLMPLLNKFSEKKILFVDMLFLSKEDLINMDISMVYRNRLLKFSEAYQKFAVDFTLEEVILFFKRNNTFNINQKLKKKNSRKKEVITHNVYHNEVFVPKNNIDKKEIILDRKESHRSNVSIDHMEINYSKDKKNVQINNINEYNNASMKSNISVIKKSNSKSNLFSKFQKISKEIEKYMNEYNVINNHDRQINKRHNIKCLNRHASYRNIKNENKMLNRNKSMTNVNDRKTSNNHSSINNIVVCPNNQNVNQSININQNHEDSNETVTIHTSCMKKFNDLQKQKELLKSSLNNCNNVIKERKKLIKLLEDELIM